MAWRNNADRGSTSAWRATRERVIARDPLCRIHDDGCTEIATEVDHIVAPRDGGTDDDDNLRGVCHPCHAKRTGRQSAASRPRLHRPPERHPGLL